MACNPGTQVQLVQQVFPLLAPVDDGQTDGCEGFLSLESVATPPNLWLRLSFPAPGSPHGPRAIECSRELEQLLGSFSGALHKRLHNCATAASFLLELRDILERALMHRMGSQPPPAELHPQLFEELEGVGWQRIKSLEPDLSKLCIAAEDAADYPKRAPAVAADLPEPLSLHWTAASGLRHVIQQWEQALQQWQELWDCLQELDERAWVLEPRGRPPPGSCAWRRLALGGHTSVTLALNPRHPRLPPQLHFAGPASRTEALQQSSFRRMQLWSEFMSTHSNLEAVLGVQLPGRDDGSQAAADDMSMDCSICYAHTLPNPADAEAPGLVPDVHCRTAACGRPFHSCCLVEWLVSLPTTTRALNKVFGECPYCGATLCVDVLQAPTGA